jgi:hypothetical protein
MTAAQKVGADAATVEPGDDHGTSDRAAVPPLSDAARLAAELVALERQFPPPDESDILADCRWFQGHLGTGVLAPYRGTHVAVYNGQVVGSGADSLRLGIDLARTLGVHPQRLVIEYVPRPTDS